MKKALKIIIPIVIVLIVCIVAILYLRPRIAVYQAIHDAMEANYVTELGATGIPYTEYSVTDDSLVMTQTPYYTIGIPADYQKDDAYPLDTGIVYRDETKDECVIIITETDELNMNLLNPEYYQDDNSLFHINEKYLAQGFKKLGYGMPDNYYNTYKCALSITEDDYDFFSLSKSLAYYCLVPFRTMAPHYADGINSRVYFYETDNKYAIITEQYNETFDGYMYWIDVLDPDYLNYPHSLLIYFLDDPNQAYAIINSIEFHE